MKGQIETRRLEDLKDHPRQKELAGDISEAALAELARDMKDRGLQHPIEVLEDGTIIGGHQRAKAARSLGLETIDVIVRDDLGDVNDPKVLAHLVGDNVIRRQGDVIGIARAYRALKQLEQSREWDDLRHEDRRDTRDRIGEVLGMTGRNLDRLEQLLDLPRPIQDAVSRKQLTQTAALKIWHLPERKQQEIAAAIAEGCAAKEVVSEYLPSSDTEPVLRSQIYARFMQQLEKAVDELLPHIDDLVGALPAGQGVALLDRGIELLDELRDREIEADQESGDDFDEEDDA